jgi:hypothetical protein
VSHRVWAYQRVGAARAPRVDRDHPELLAERLHDRLEHRKPVGERSDEDQRLGASPVLVEGDPRSVADGSPWAMSLALAAAPVPGIGCDRQGLLVAAVGLLEIAFKAREVAQQDQSAHLVPDQLRGRRTIPLPAHLDQA